MPKLTMIDPATIVSTRGGRPTSEATAQLVADCLASLQGAIASGQAISVVLDDDERPTSVKNAFSAAAETLSVGVNFVTAPNGTRPYTTRKGVEKTEIFTFAVKIVPLSETEVVTDESDEEAA